MLLMVHLPSSSLFTVQVPEIEQTLFSEFTKFLGAVAAFFTPATIVGDIDVCLYLPDDGDTVALLDVIPSYDLSQFVTESTHHLGGLLDVVITSNSNAPQDYVLRNLVYLTTCYCRGRLMEHRRSQFLKQPQAVWKNIDFGNFHLNWRVLNSVRVR